MTTFLREKTTRVRNFNSLQGNIRNTTLSINLIIPVNIIDLTMK